MNRRITALALCAATLLAVLPCGTAAAETAPWIECAGEAVETVVLDAAQRRTITARTDADGQWQIACDDIWADIAGQTEKTLCVSYALIASALDGESAMLRYACGGQAIAGPVTVTLAPADADAPADLQRASAAAEPAASDVAALTAEAAPQTGLYTVTIEYMLSSGERAAPSWTAQLSAGSTLRQTVQSPAVTGYEPDQEAVELDIESLDGDRSVVVTYYPAETTFTVLHYYQRVDADDYELARSQTRTGRTGDMVGDGLTDTPEGFYAMRYDASTRIAADGSTVIELYYDRYYYLMRFDLDGGYGVEPVYARFGAPIAAGTPTRAGYTFLGWDPQVPETMPAENTTHTALWSEGTAGFTVVFWYENADDDGYSAAGTYTPADVTPGTTVSSGDYRNQAFDGRDTAHFTYNAAKAETVTVAGDGSTVLNVYFKRNTYTLTFKDEYGYTNLEVITAKYQQDIHTSFPILNKAGETIWWTVPHGCKTYVPGNELGSIDIMPGENITFTASDPTKATWLWYYVEALPGDSADTTYSGKSFKLYKKINCDGTSTLTKKEEFHDIRGFTQWRSDPKFNSEGKAQQKKNNYFYYARDSYRLQFYNYNAYVTDKEASVLYEAPLGGYDFTPYYPEGLEKDAYVFDGWYRTAGCYEGSEADLSEMTMPASDLILYARWTPKSHRVRTYLSESALNTGGAAIGTWDTVPHGTAVESPPDDPAREGYRFVGWFYRGADGAEHAYDFSIPVTRDMELYAKWSSDTLVAYTIRYRLADGTPVAPDTTGYAPGGATRTFAAKAGTELYEGYQTGYFPNVASHSLTMDLDDAAQNEFTFTYEPAEKLSYTVRYLERGTNAALHEEKTAETLDAIVTERFAAVEGYAPDAYEKRLILTMGENILIFWYDRDDAHAPVRTVHYVQNVAGDGYTVYRASEDAGGVIGQTYDAAPLALAGFTYQAEKSTPSGVLTAAGLLLTLYYDRTQYPYEVRYLELGTEKPLADADAGMARCGAFLTFTAPAIAGYELVSTAQQSMTIAVEDPADAAKKNVRTFYYRACPAALTVKKSGCAAEDAEACFLFTVTGPGGFQAQLSIAGNGAATLTGLPAGTYTVREETDWSWRYTPEDAEQTVVLKNGGTGEAIFQNSRTDDRWLTADAHCDNHFTG